MKALYSGLALLVVSAGFLSGRLFFDPVDPAAPEIGGFVLEPTRPLPAFELVNGDVRPFGPEDFTGAWSFLYFGFTYCPDICPMSLVEMARLKQMLDESHPALDTAFYLVSVDPERDTPARMKEYVGYFHDSFVGLTGGIDEISKLARAASVIHVIESSADGESYEVGHSSTITLLNPAGQIQAIFREPLRADGLARDVGRILEYAQALR